MGHKNRNNTIPQYTDHCFTGDYPTDLKIEMEDPYLNNFHSYMKKSDPLAMPFYKGFCPS